MNPSLLAGSTVSGPSTTDSARRQQLPGGSMTCVLDVIPPVVDVVTKGTDWPTIATGVVGVAGIIGTSWQGKRAREATSQDLRDSLRADTDRALTADRRGVYANFLAATNKMLIADADFEGNWAAADEETKNLLVESYNAPLSELFIALAEVKLVAPETIGDVAGTIGGLLADHYNALVHDEAT